MELNELYNEVLIEHYQKPFNKKVLKDYNFDYEGVNPSCGDQIHLYLKLNKTNDKITIQEISFQGSGCSISIASTSIMCYIISTLKEFNLMKIKDFANKVIEYIKGQIPYEDIFKNEFKDYKNEFQDLLALNYINKIPVRLKCALLSWITLKELIENEIENKIENKIEKPE